MVHRLRNLFMQGDHLTMTGNTLWTRSFGTLLVAAALSVATSQAQQSLPTPPGDDSDLPPEITFEAPGAESRPSEKSVVVPELVGPGEDLGPAPSPFYDSECGDHDYDLWDGLPALTESSGTWLRRGFFYSEVDAVILNRFWNRRDIFLATDDQETDTPIISRGSNTQGTTSGTISNVPVPGIQPNTSLTNKKLFLKGSHPGADAGVRFTLGRFLFRDPDNRDHTAEFTGFTAGEFKHDNFLRGTPLDVSPNPNRNLLVVPLVLDGSPSTEASQGIISVTGTYPSFDGSLEQRAIYTSEFYSLEGNYRVKRRMRKDQMVMLPTGEWVRRASPGVTREFLIGLRYFELSERLDWTAEDLHLTAPPPTIVGEPFQDLVPWQPPFNGGIEDGRYLIETNNDLIGVQIGGGHTYETARWNVGMLGKAGVYLNDVTGAADFSITNRDDLSFMNNMAEDQLSFVGELRITSRWHLTPNFSLRGGYEMMYITSVALAPHQINFLPGYTQLSTSGDPFYHGASFGFEGYW